MIYIQKAFDVLIILHSFFTYLNQKARISSRSMIAEVHSQAASHMAEYEKWFCLAMRYLFP